MNNLGLFTAALMLNEPWKVIDVKFIDIKIDFNKSGQFLCPSDGCTETLKAYDTISKTWRHLNFFKYKTYIQARVPRTNCDKHGVHITIMIDEYDILLWRFI